MSLNKNLLYVLYILKTYSDENHILSMGDIKTKMKAIYDVSIDRRTIYAIIETLNENGYEISAFDPKNSKGYYLQSREFEPSEIRLLMDRVYSASFLPQKQSKELIDKLQSFLSVHQRKKYTHLRSVNISRKSKNQTVFYNIEQLDDAIDKKVKVEFDYCEIDVNKKLVKRRNEKYIVNPYQLVCAHEKYYLIGNYDKYDDLSHYRIDLMQNITLIADRIKPLPKNINLTEYGNALIYAFDGKIEDVEIICDNLMAGEVLERFGNDTKFHIIDNEHFKINVRVAPLGVKFWALQFLQYCEVTKPQWLRTELTELMLNNKYTK